MNLEWGEKKRLTSKSVKPAKKWMNEWMKIKSLSKCSPIYMQCKGREGAQKFTGMGLHQGINLLSGGN